MSEPETILGVVPPMGDHSAYELAQAAVENAMVETKRRLEELRHQRDEVLAPEIRALVAEQEILDRMMRASKRKPPSSE